MEEDGGSKVVYFLAGLALGAFVGLVVIPPKSGKETRDLLSDRANESAEFARRKARELRERADELIARSRKGDSLVAIEAAREAYGEEIAEAAGPHGPGEPEPDDDDEPQPRKSNVD